MHTTDHPQLDPQDPTLDLGSKALGMIVPGLIVAAIGGAVAYYFGIYAPSADAAHSHIPVPSLFYHAYLVAFLFYLTITLGALFFVMLHHAVRAGWSTTIRRLAEALSGNIALMLVLFLPIVFGLSEIYIWAVKPPAAQAVAEKKDETKAEKKQEKSEEKESAPQKLLADTSDKATPAKEDDDKADAKKPAAKKAPAEAEEDDSHGATVGYRYWCTTNGFIGRWVIYFVIWGFLTWYYRAHSIRQDRSGNVALTRSMERLAPVGIILFALTLTGAAVDLIMSLNPHWFSTMIGVYVFAESVLNSLVTITLLTMVLQSWGLLRGVVNVEHYHDLGKLILGFIVFWAYIAFSQYMLIWYANIPEETQFYIPRQLGPWAAVALTLVIVHFVLPFFGLMSRHAKRTLPVFAFWLIWLLVAHVFDLFWLIMPNVFIRQLPVSGTKGIELPEVFKTYLESQQSVYQLSPAHQKFAAAVHAPLTFWSIATVAGLLLFMGGLYVAWTGWLLSGARLVPVKDPRLEESLAFHNT